MNPASTAMQIIPSLMVPLLKPKRANPNVRARMVKSSACASFNACTSASMLCPPCLIPGCCFPVILNLLYVIYAMGVRVGVAVIFCVVTHSAVAHPLCR